MRTDNSRDTFRLRSRVVMGVVFAGTLVAAAAGWAANAQLSGAVIAHGVVSVDQNLKSIQHRDGGIVSEIAVRKGDAVEAGQVLLRLDDVQTKAELSIVETQLLELTVRRARLLAEREGQAGIEFPSHLSPGDQETQILMQGEKRLFGGSRENRESQKQQLELGIAQIGDEIRGLESQRDAKSREINLVDDEFAKMKGLADSRLIERSRVRSVERDLARLLGERGEIDANIARAKSRASEIKLQIISIDQTARTEAQRELALVELKMSELRDRQMAVSDRLARTEIRAPIAGVVNELNIHTLGGVITPAEVLVTIVPDDAKLHVEVKLDPTSIDQVSVGQTARLRLTALNQRTTPELIGSVTHVSPATSLETSTGQRHYIGDIDIPPAELEKIGDARLIPGMPVEVYVTTADRTALSYLMKPITDQFNKAFRER